MLGLDFSELLIIGVVALVVVGPKELPQLMRTVGQWVGKARRMATEFQGQMNEAIREAELDDVKKHVDDLRSLSPKALLAEQFSSVTRTLDEVKRDTEAEMAGIEAGVSAPTVADGGTVEAPTGDGRGRDRRADRRGLADADGSDRAGVRSDPGAGQPGRGRRGGAGRVRTGRSEERA